MRAVIHAKPEPLPLETDDAGTSWPDHLDLGTIVEAHLPQAMNHIARTQDCSDAPPLSRAQPAEGNQIDLSFLRSCLTRCLHAWASIVSGKSLVTEARGYH
jgi:hypothetical protein